MSKYEGQHCTLKMVLPTRDPETDNFLRQCAEAGLKFLEEAYCGPIIHPYSACGECGVPLDATNHDFLGVEHPKSCVQKRLSDTVAKIERELERLITRVEGLPRAHYVKQQVLPSLKSAQYRLKDAINTPVWPTLSDAVRIARGDPPGTPIPGLKRA